MIEDANNQNGSYIIIISRLIVILIFSVAMISSIFIIGILCFVALNISSVNNEFCDTDGKVYQAIIENIDDWIDTFSEYSSHYSPLYRIGFSVQGVSGRYTVVVEYPKNIAILYVSTRSGWPNNPQGSMGYLYILDDSAMNYWLQEYNVQHLDGHVYCYSK